jgi:hypothetical protein
MKVKEKDKNIKAGKKSKTAMDVEGFKPKWCSFLLILYVGQGCICFLPYQISFNYLILQEK